MSSSLIAVSHVFKSVTDATGTLDILRDINFSLNARQTLAIVGASGSGKSTLLAIMAGLDTPTQGTVHIAGQDLFVLDEDQRAALRAKHIGFVFQSFQLLAPRCRPIVSRNNSLACRPIVSRITIHWHVAL